ncbi:helix-turn-helix domain-containing protein [Bacillus sp. E(2018)]|uniref:helix-turn-helix domain-containing protein n=1 Tax=Bacillus sp. E(2018) TaxID=2502239 RepID=UPI0010F7CC8D|nr:helix-turn-helix domain-containing protein [Bacillus sp. E(2018)]
MNISTQIGLKIKEMRTLQKMTQEELSKGIVNRSFISQLEKGMVSPSIETLEKLAHRLDCSISYLIGQTERNSALEQLNISSLLDNIESYINESLIDKGKKAFESLSGEWIERMNTYEKGKYLWVKARLKWFEGDYQEAEIIIQKAIDLLEDQYTNQLGKLYNFLGIISFRLKKIEKSFNSFTSALTYTHQFPSDYNLKVETNLNMGVYHTHLKEYQSAAFYLKKALEAAESHSSLFKLGEIQMTLGITYKNLRSYDLAIHSYLQAEEIFKINSENEQLAAVYYNLGLLYKEKESIAKATDYFMNAKQIYLSLLNSELGTKCDVQIIKNFLLENDYVKAYEVWQNIETAINNEYDRLLLKGIFHLQNFKNYKNHDDLIQSVGFFKEALNSTDDLDRKLDLQKHVYKHFIKEELFEEAKEILSSL